MKRFLFFLSWVFITVSVKAQVDTALLNRENRLVTLLDELRASTSDDLKKEKNEPFKEYLKETLALKASFTYPFSNLKTVGIIDSPDKKLRIINWNVEQSDQTQLYYGFVLFEDSKKKNILVTELIDNYQNIPPRSDEVLAADNWYGALYYKIIPIQKSGKTMYTLLGWDGNNSMSTVKLIDVLYFSGSNIKFGSPIFKMNGEIHKRVFFEHSKKTVMSLKYEEEYKRIIFDHLSPESPNLEGFRAFYVPDFSYDAFVYQSSKWQLKEDVIGVNKGGSKKLNVYVEDSKTGKVEKKTIDNKWETPEGYLQPNQEMKHVAVTPEMNEDTSNSKKEDSGTRKRSDRRNPASLNSTLGKRKKKNP
jgi:hypothetical protein